MNRSFEIEALGPRRLFAGVMLLITERLGGSNGWISAMSDDASTNADHTSSYIGQVVADTVMDTWFPEHHHRAALDASAAAAAGPG